MKSERNDDLNTSNDDNAKVSPSEEVKGAEALVDNDLKDVTKDLKETVTNIEAKKLRATTFAIIKLEEQ